MLIHEIKLKKDHTKADLDQAVARKLHCRTAPEYRIVRLSLDARKKPDVKKVYSVDTGKKKQIYEMPVPGKTVMHHRPVVIGAGPAGLFCAYLLAVNGYRPLIIERGKPVEQRKEDVRKFWETGILDPSSNVQFGEGGAGTFSDGKLNTGVSDHYGRKQLILETFVGCGAPEDILYMAHPHIGTDYLCKVIAQLRMKIEELGGTFLFGRTVTGISESVLILDKGEPVPYEHAVLAIGHSARDTFFMLRETGAQMEAKPFAVGVRAEHPQSSINLAQYGSTDIRGLWPAEYKLATRLDNGRNVYSFCMCPGGEVVNASSEEGYLCVNGMSNHARDGHNANAAIVVNVTPDDFGKEPLDGVAFQRDLERKAFELNNGRIPEETYGEFCQAVRGQKDPHGTLAGIFPDYISDSISEGIHRFGMQIKGYDDPETVLKGVESRTSSPVRILRDEHFRSNLPGIYPCGEGAGYAGGIMSAAIDGLKVAEEIIRNNAQPLN